MLFIHIICVLIVSLFLYITYKEFNPCKHNWEIKPTWFGYWEKHTCKKCGKTFDRDVDEYDNDLRFF